MSDVRHCPSCGDQFRPGIVDCPDCGVALLDRDEIAGSDTGAAPPTEGGGAPAEGTDAADDADADADDADADAEGTDARADAVAAALQAARPDLADAGPTVVYEVADWPPAVQTRLARLLDRAGIAHQWDAAGDLVVAEADEDRVEALFDEIDESELAAGPDPLPVLEALHEDLARLARDPLDGRARRGVTERAGDLAAASLPFGFDARVWRSLVGSVEALAGDLGDLDPPELRDRAAALRDDLRSWL